MLAILGEVDSSVNKGYPQPAPKKGLRSQFAPLSNDLFILPNAAMFSLLFLQDDHHLGSCMKMFAAVS